MARKRGTKTAPNAGYDEKEADEADEADEVEPAIAPEILELHRQRRRRLVEFFARELARAIVE